MLIQDGTTKHTNRKTIKFFNKIPILTQSLKSPDLNLVELVCDYLKKKLSKLNLNSKEELIEVIKEILEQMSYEQIYKTINKVIDGREPKVIKFQEALKKLKNKI